MSMFCFQQLNTEFSVGLPHPVTTQDRTVEPQDTIERLLDVGLSYDMHSRATGSLRKCTLQGERALSLAFVDTLPSYFQTHILSIQTFPTGHRFTFLLDGMPPACSLPSRNPHTPVASDHTVSTSSSLSSLSPLALSQLKHQHLFSLPERCEPPSRRTSPSTWPPCANIPAIVHEPLHLHSKPPVALPHR